MAKVTMATPNHKSVVRDILYPCGQGYIMIYPWIYHDISLTTGLYVKYTLVVSFDLRC